MDHRHSVAGRWGVACSDNVRWIISSSCGLNSIRATFIAISRFQDFFWLITQNLQLFAVLVTVVTESMA